MWVVVGGGGGLKQFSVSPRPLGSGFGAKGSGPGLDNISIICCAFVRADCR